MTLVIGKDDWPFPIPLKKANDRWLFDTAAGKEEILNRRIGENELSTIQTMLAYVDAQGDYAEFQRQRSGTPEYAQRILSSPGKMDGLYWPARRASHRARSVRWWPPREPWATGDQPIPKSRHPTTGIFTRC